MPLASKIVHILWMIPILYELEKFYPEKVEGTIPTIEEIEMKLNQIMS